MSVKWMPCKTMQPETGDEYLCAIKRLECGQLSPFTGYGVYARVSTMMNPQGCWNCPDNVLVTHWAPINSPLASK